MKDNLQQTGCPYCQCWKEAICLQKTRPRSVVKKQLEIAPVHNVLTETSACPGSRPGVSTPMRLWKCCKTYWTCRVCEQAEVPIQDKFVLPEGSAIETIQKMYPDQHIFSNIRVLNTKYSLIENILPTGRIVVEKVKRPSKDCIYLSNFFSLQTSDNKRCFSLTIFLTGSLNSFLTVSIVIPKNLMQLVGQIVFSFANGTPNSWQMSKNIFKRDMHWLESQNP